MVRCTAEAKNLEKLKLDLQRAQEDAVTMYTTKTNELQQKYRTIKAQSVAKAAT